MQTLIESAR